MTHLTQMISLIRDSCDYYFIFYDFTDQGRSQELEMGGAKLLGEGSGGRFRPKGGCTCGNPHPRPRQ